MILSIEQVSISSREKRIVDNVSLSIREGEWCALVGQSGSGKTLLSQAIGQILSPNLQVEGKILFKEKDLLLLSQKQMRTIRGQKLSYIFQDYQGSLHLLERLASILRNIRKHTTFLMQKCGR